MTNPRYDFYDEDGNFRVEIQTQKNAWVVAGLALYFLVNLPHKLWRFYEMIEREMLPPAQPETGVVFMIFSLGILFILVIALAVVWLLWSLFGREVIEIQQEKLVVKLDLFNFGPERSYWLHRISTMQVKMQKSPMVSILKGGNIEFLYEGKPQRLGWTLMKEDAEAIIGTLKPHLREKVIQLVK